MTTRYSAWWHEANTPLNSLSENSGDQVTHLTVSAFTADNFGIGVREMESDFDMSMQPEEFVNYLAERVKYKTSIKALDQIESIFFDGGGLAGKAVRRNITYYSFIERFAEVVNRRFPNVTKVSGCSYCELRSRYLNEAMDITVSDSSDFNALAANLDTRDVSVEDYLSGNLPKDFFAEPPLPKIVNWAIDNDSRLFNETEAIARFIPGKNHENELEKPFFREVIIDPSSGGSKVTKINPPPLEDTRLKMFITKKLLLNLNY